MPDDIDNLLAEAQLRSKFDATVHEFADLVEIVEKYVDAEEFIIDTRDDFCEDELDALDKLGSDLSQVASELKHIGTLLYGGLA